MKMIGWLILGGGTLYLLDKMGILGGIVPTASGAPIASSPQAANATNATAVISSNTTLQAILAELSNAGVNPQSLQTVYTWNYYYTKARGVNGPDPSMILPNNPNAATEQISLSEWWSGMNSAGFSGMGAIAHHVNPYLQGPRATMRAFGAGLAPTGMETYIKQVG